MTFPKPASWAVPVAIGLVAGAVLGVAVALMVSGAATQAHTAQCASNDHGRSASVRCSTAVESIRELDETVIVRCAQ